MKDYLEKTKNDTEEMLLWFCSMSELELPEKYKLLEMYSSVEEIYEKGRRDSLSQDLSPRVRNIVKKHCDGYSFSSVCESLWKKDARFISCHSPEYPSKFKVLDMPPIGFFCIGKMPEEGTPSLAVVGARGCSEYGLAICKSFVNKLTLGKVQIISGLALGIDGASHKACMEAGGLTFAVLGNGIGAVYPAENRDIYYNIIETGGIISEYYIGCRSIKTHFPERNRLIAGLSDGVLVIEARKKSGTMITVNRSLEQGKDVFVIPGRIGDPLSEGCLELIKRGAALVTDVSDIAFALKDKYPEFINYSMDENDQYCFGSAESKKPAELSPEETKILSLIGRSPVFFDELVAKSAIDYFRLFDIVEGLKEKKMLAETNGGELYKT